MHETRNVNGIQMRWLEHGTGMPVVMIHGLPTSPALWRRVIPKLKGCRAVAWEMVGYGESIPEGSGRNVSVAQQAKYLLSFLAALGIDRAILVGHDLGGGVALIAALREPGRCGGLVLTNSIGYDSWPIPGVRVMQAFRPVVARLPRVMLRGLFAILFRRGHDDRELAKQALDIYYMAYARHGGSAALANQIAWLDNVDTRKIDHRLYELRKVPARVVWGAADPFLKLHYGERFARDLSCSIRRIPGGKHFVPEDHPTEVADAIQDVLAELRSGRSAELTRRTA